MFGWIKKRIARSRMKKMEESAFLILDNHCHDEWFSDWFTITMGDYYPRYYIISPIIQFNSRLKHASLIEKYTQNGPNSLLTDYSSDFRRVFSFDMKEFKDYGSDSYLMMKKIYTVLQIWDDLLDCPVNQAMLEAGVHIQTASWCMTEDYSEMWVNPTQAEILFNTLDDLYKYAIGIDKEVVARYKDYVLTKFAEYIDSISASQPSIKIDTFSNRRVKIMKAIKEEDDSQKLSIIQKIKDKKEELMQENDKK